MTTWILAIFCVFWHSVPSLLAYVNQTKSLVAKSFTRCIFVTILARGLETSSGKIREAGRNSENPQPVGSTSCIREYVLKSHF
jgi:hypothetical protein